MSDDVKRLACDLQAADNTVRLQDIHALLEIVLFATPHTLTTVWNILDAAGFTTKQMHKHAAARNTLDMKQRRKQWVERVGPTLLSDSVIFIDESPFSFCITRSRGKSMKGEPAIITTPQIRGKNHTVIAALSPTRGLVHFEIKVTEPDVQFIRKRSKKKKKTAPKGVDRDRFRSFLINLFATPAFASASSPFTLVFDNAPIHLGDIRDAIFQAGHMQQLLPPYSPELNPIELAFSKWKLLFRAKHADSEGAVDDAIREAAKSITPADCQRWFEHTRSLYDKCSRLEDV
jgi:hypothetical protein